MEKLGKHLLLIVVVFLLPVACFSVELQGISLFVNDSPVELRIKVAHAGIVVNKLPWKMSFYGEDGKMRSSEVVPPSFRINEKWVSVAKVLQVEKQDEGKVRLDVALSDGGKGTVIISPASESGFRISITCDGVKVSAIRGISSLAPVEEIYGFGEMWNGHVAQRGQSFDLWDKGGTPDECAYMPYYVSTNNYAFFLNYGGQVSFDVGQSNSDELVFQAGTSGFDFTLISGNSLANAVQNFLAVTGMPAAPPRWSFKPWFWLMHDPDKPGADISSLKGEHFPLMIKKLQALDIPVGVTWLEPPWQDALTSFIPNKEFCTDLKGLIADISNLGVKTLAWSVPYTTNSASNWKEAVEKGYLVSKPAGEKGDNNFTITSSGELEGNYYTAIDYFNPEASRWWQQQIEKSLELGLRGYKPDAGQDLPGDAILYGGRSGKDVHNSYALEYNKVYYRALKNKWGDDFLMIPRAAWIGSTSFTNFKWPGDLSSNFANNGLPSTVYSSLSLALSGIPFVSTDIGGFEGRPAPEDVWIRWAQFGAFLPGMQTLHMPWWYSEKAIKHFRYLTWLHTDLIPFWMSLANEAKSTGTPVIRPLVWDYQNDVKCWRTDDEFTLGNAILVAPIMNTNAGREVYLPEGLWFDFWNEKETVQGPVKVTWNKGRGDSFYKFPVYVREGAIIPMEICNDVTGFGSVASKGFVTLAIWPKTKGISEFALKDTEDVVRIKVERDSDNQINVSWGKTSKNYILRVHLANDNVPVEIKTSEKDILQGGYNNLEAFQTDNNEGWYFDTTTGNLWVRKMNAGNITIALKHTK